MHMAIGIIVPRYVGDLDMWGYWQLIVVWKSYSKSSSIETHTFKTYRLCRLQPAHNIFMGQTGICKSKGKILLGIFSLHVYNLVVSELVYCLWR